jgi:hypothetical protein
VTTDRLLPAHLEDLHRSGLSDATIAAAGIRSLVTGEFSSQLGTWLAAKVSSAYLLPYPGTDFARIKLIPPLSTENGTIRYYQAPGTAPRLYIPPPARAVLADSAVAVRLTEGEKKCLRADQAGLVCIGLGGLWNWMHDGRPIDDLDRVDWVRRCVILTPDSEVWTRPELMQAVYALGRDLQERGAVVSIEKLPAGPCGAKVGLDDYLLEHTVAELEALPKLPLNDPAFSKTSTWWKGWRARKSEAGQASAVELLERGETTRALHPAQDVLDGVLWYGVPIAGALALVTSERHTDKARALPSGLTLRHPDLSESSVSRDVALAWIAGETGSVAGTLDALAEFFARFVIFREARTPALLAAWALGTWCYRAFRIFPYLSLRSPERRCGKTRVLKLLRHVAFNAGPVTAVPTEAQLFRGAATMGGTQLLDEVDRLQGDKERFEALIAVLNIGFEHGGYVTRMEKRGERFVEQRYEAYAPRALAGLARLAETLADRAIPVFMTRKRREERVSRLTAAVEPEAATLRDRCALACLAHIGHILTAGDQALGLLELTAIDDRAVDLWAPLLALALVGDGEDGGDRAGRLIGLARELAELRDADAEEDQTARLVAALTAIRQTQGEELAPADLLAALQARPGFAWVKSTKRLAGLLSPLGFVNQRRREGDRLRWRYRLDGDALADLRARFGGAGEAEPEAGT